MAGTGRPKTGGRKKGTRNKATIMAEATLKKAIEQKLVTVEHVQNTDARYAAQAALIEQMKAAAGASDAIPPQMRLYANPLEFARDMCLDISTPLPTRFEFLKVCLPHLAPRLQAQVDKSGQDVKPVEAVKILIIEGGVDASGNTEGNVLFDLPSLTEEG